MNILRKSAGVLCLLAASTTCAVAGITIATPTNTSAVGSPFTLTASAPTCANQTVFSMGYSLDSGVLPTIEGGNSLNVQISAPAGAHTVYVQAWGSWGAICLAEVAITVAAGPSIPQDAISASSLQTLSNWIAAGDVEGSGDSSGTMSLVSSPSYGGEALQFVTQFTNAGDERYSVVFGEDTSATNFVWDGWVYLDQSVSDIANLEMDMNQVLANGQTVIFGFQCDGYSGTWDYTTNAGTPESPIDEWVHSNAACNLQDWSIETWHHVQVVYSRDSSGNVTYSSVWLDGVESEINATVPSAFALGWGTVLLTNFEVDGAGASGTSTVYLDDLTVYRWGDEVPEGRSRVSRR
jgi:hypothetical protein